MQRSRLFGLLTTAAYVFAFVIFPVFSAPQAAFADDCPTETDIQGKINSANGQWTAAQSNATKTYVDQFGYGAYQLNVVTMSKLLPEINGMLSKYAAGGCGDVTKFNTLSANFSATTNSFNGLLDFYNKTSPAAALSQFKPTPVAYQDKANAECTQLVATVQQDTALAKSAMTAASDGINKWLRDTSENNAADAAMTTAATALKKAKDGLAAAKAKNCDTNPATKDAFAAAQADINALMQKVIAINEKIAASGKSLMNQLWNGLLDAIVQVDSCGCGDLGQPGVVGVINGIFNRAICLTICTISVALGVIACFIIGNLIDPVFGNADASGKQVATCDANPDANSAKTPPKAPATPGAKPTPASSTATKPATTPPTPTPAKTT